MAGPRISRPGAHLLGAYATLASAVELPPVPDLRAHLAVRQRGCRALRQSRSEQEFRSRRRDRR
jgi:hypothetical protein